MNLVTVTREAVMGCAPHVQHRVKKSDGCVTLVPHCSLTVWDGLSPGSVTVCLWAVSCPSLGSLALVPSSRGHMLR